MKAWNLRWKDAIINQIGVTRNDLSNHFIQVSELKNKLKILILGIFDWTT